MNPDGRDLVLFGCGSLGLAVAGTLRERGVDFLLVSPEPERVEAARAKGYDVVQIDYTDDDALTSIGIGAGVRMIFCLFEETAANLFLTLSARALAPTLTIVSICDSPATSSKLIAAGASKTIDPFLLTGRWVHNLIRRPLIVETLYDVLLGGADLEVGEVALAPDTMLVGRRLGDLNSDRYDVIVLGAVNRSRGTELLLRSNDPGYVLAPDDVLVVIGPQSEIDRIRQDPNLGSGRVTRVDPSL